MRSKVTWI